MFQFIVMKRILICGAYGQVGQELIRFFSKRIGMERLVCTDLHPPPKHLGIVHHEILNALDKDGIESIIQKYEVEQVYSLAALLSATGEIDPLKTQHINMTSLFNVLELAREGKIKRLFWPSSIAALGDNSPKTAPQATIMDPSTVYGITKKSGELWCQYYHRRYGVDVRSIRYPGLVGYRSAPGGGTTDYAVDIFHKAIMGEPYICYLQSNTYLPMMYTDDAIRATFELMQAPSKCISVRTSYNVHAMSFSPNEVAAAIQK